MIKVGKKTRAKYWGEFTVEKVIKLDNPVRCFSVEKGEVDCSSSGGFGLM
jgi:hypothetical protein